MVTAMSEHRRWYLRHTVLAVLLAVASVLVALAMVLAGRALLVLASVAPRAEHWREVAEQPGEVVYVALGDSLSQGIGSSSPGTSFVGALADDLRERRDEDVGVVNLAVTGATAGELVEDQLPQLDRLLAELQAEGREPALVTLLIGANDAGVTEPEVFGEQLRTILDAVPDGTYVGDVPDFNGGPRLEPAAALSAVVREEVARRDGLVLVPVEAATADLRLRDYAADFFHPSDRGYQRYIDAFRAAVAQQEDAA